MNRTMIVSWDRTGLESCRDITDLLSASDDQERHNLLERIIDPDSVPVNQARLELNTWINVLMLRANANSHRNYEIYVVDVDPGITADDITQQFDAVPQDMANLVRARGKKIFGHQTRNNTRIT